MGIPTRVIPAWASAAGFTLLASVLAATGQLPTVDALWASSAVAAAYLPTGWCDPVGWRRRAAEAALLPAACALMLVTDLTMRRMLLAPLLAVAAMAVVGAALSRCPTRYRPILTGCLALAVQLAAGVGLTGAAPAAAAVAVVAATAAGWAAGYWGTTTGVSVALVLGALPLARWPASSAVVAVVAVWLYPWGRRIGVHSKVMMAWLPTVAGASLIGLALAPWGRISIGWAFPEAGWLCVAVLGVALVATARAPAAVAGAIWFVALMAVGPAQPAPPERRSIQLQAAGDEAALPRGTGGRYVVDVALWGARDLPSGSRVATVQVGDGVHVLRAGGDAVDAGHQLPGILDEVRHPLPHHPTWRPLRIGNDARWRVAARSELDVAEGERPLIRRDPDLPARVRIVVEAAGPSRPTPPRDWQLPAWLWATAAVVALLQVAGRRLGGWPAVLPWALLAAGQLATRIWVVPLRLVGERFAVDICLAALVAAWLPCAWRWFAVGRPFRAAAALLLPVALAMPHLTPPLFGDEPFHLVVMESLRFDRDLDISNNIDPEAVAGHRAYTVGEPLVHSPALGLLLLPGYLAAGRTGALALLAIGGALLVWLTAALARRLRVPAVRLVLLLLMMILGYPLVTYATQIWPELPGALAVAAILWAADRRAGGVLGVVFALVATAVKTRLALLAFPAAAAAAIRGSPRRRLAASAGLAGAAAAALGLGWLTMGHPFGHFRRVPDLLPTDPVLALRVVGGLLFDHAGGLAFAAPILLVAVFATPLLWRHGGAGDRAVLVGGGLTVLALLPSLEWYGGGSPPARYLAPLLPVLVSTMGVVLRAPLRWRRVVEILVPGTLLVWWALVSRPHFSINPGDGGWWLSDALARRFAADTQQFFPSFLVPTTATVWLPAAVVVAGGAVLWMTKRRPGATRLLVRLGLALWLTAAAALAAAVAVRTDRVVEIEAPQVRRRGGAPVPPVGTFSRFTHRMGWRIADRQGVIVPLNLRGGEEVWLTGWLVGNAREGAKLRVSWDDGKVKVIPVRGDDRDGRVKMPDPPGPGRHTLRIFVRSPRAGAAILDKVVVSR